ncbi:SDR family oxidoreductase [Saccharopolyspora sp. NPDC002376]
MDLGVQGKAAIVTAASRGLGRACAETLAAEGMHVLAAARDSAALGKLVGEIEEAGGTASSVACDIGDPTVPQELVDRALQLWGRVDALVVSTPGPPSMRCDEVTDDQWHQAFEMNCLVPVRLTRAVLPAMRAAGGGRIVYVGTIGVRTAQPEMVLSNATRLALMGYAKTLSVEVAVDNILINTVAPGPLATERMDALAKQTACRSGISKEAALQRWVDEVPMAKMGRPEDLANLVALLVSDSCGYTTGAVLPVDGGKASAY